MSEATDGPKAAATFRAALADLAGSVGKGVPMVGVPDIAAALVWYASIGFTELGRYADDGVVNFGMVAFGKAELMFRIGPPSEVRDTSLWFYTDRVDDLYRQLRSAEPDRTFDFVEDIYDPFYGGRQFSIRDPNGYTLVFLQPAVT